MGAQSSCLKGTPTRRIVKKCPDFEHFRRYYLELRVKGEEICHRHNAEGPPSLTMRAKALKVKLDRDIGEGDIRYISDRRVLDDLLEALAVVQNFGLWMNDRGLR